ncbi:MAG: hypothetical protein IJF02_03330 [Oscillospiraceae bacterium]|nr:hypothetical protein [Oscillospiraceae bacterium]
MKKHFTTKTCVLSLILSAAAGLGMYSLLLLASCYLDSNPSRHPIAFPASILSGTIALTVFFFCLYKYAQARSAAPSLWGTIADVLGAILLSPGFGYLFALLAEVARKILKPLWT